MSEQPEADPTETEESAQPERSERAAESDGAGEPADPARRATWGRPQVVVCAVLAAALVVSAVLGFTAWRDLQRERDLATAAADAQDAASAAVVRMTTYDHRTVEDDFAWVEDAGTPAFQEYFARASRDAIELIRTLRASAEGTVVDAAAEAESRDRVHVLLFVDQEIRGGRDREARLDQPRVSMEMVRRDGEWLVDEVGINNVIDDGGQDGGE